MDDLYYLALLNMENAVHSFASRVQEPVRVTFKDGFNYRYDEKTIHQALVQKLARLLSSLNAARLLMEHGFHQEQASLQRILNEIQEDITFLSFSIIFNNFTDTHQKYLDAFWKEELSVIMNSEDTKKSTVPRKKIHAYIANMKGADTNPSRGVELSRIITKTYSGYIHAASPYIMDMYCGNPPYFHVKGMLDTEFHLDHREDLWNYFFRSIVAFCFAAKAFGDEDLFNKINKFQYDFMSNSGRNYY